ncbi:MAG: hypothetical protein KJS95_05700 [Gammaproteobacteria bacterium]|nr:hypothetical protein [Gammaproteobacteria bacterium]
MKDFLYRKPVLGLLGLLAGFLTQPLGHTVYKIMEAVFRSQVYVAAFVVAIVGFVIVWRGLRQNELKATWMGMIGGWLIWIGWFEYSFKFFAELYSVPAFPVEVDGYAAAPQAIMLQATVTIMFALLLLYGVFNLQTKCNFMRFFHRNLRFSPGMPTPDNQRSFARITAMEMLFVTWFCYQFWLYMIYFGTRAPGVNVVMAVYVLWTIWAIYLVYKCTQQVRVAPALRYGIGAGIVLWGSAEMPAHFGAYREYWLYPQEYPVFNIITSLVFVSVLVLLARRLPPAQRATTAVPADGG